MSDILELDEIALRKDELPECICKEYDTINRFEPIDEDRCIDCPQVFIEDVLRSHEALRSELAILREQTRWIPVEERLPNEVPTHYTPGPDDPVILFMRRISTRMPHRVLAFRRHAEWWYYEVDVFSFRRNDPLVFMPIAWQPLPPTND